MTQPTLAVLDGNGNPATINTINPNGQALAADSQPVVLTAIQLAAIQQPTSGSATSANSKPVVIASDQAAVPISNTALTALATATVKAASTAPGATDPAIVVAISPNGQPTNGAATSANSRSTVSATDDVNVGPQVIVAGATIGGVNQDIIVATSVLQYRGAYFQLTNAGTSCTITVQGSNDNSTFFSVSTQDVTSPTASVPNPLLTSAKLVFIPLGFAYLRIRCTAYGSGSPTGTLTLSPIAVSVPPMFASGITPQAVITSGPTGFAHGTNAVTSVINVNVKSSGANLCVVNLSNSNATTKLYFKLFNKASTATLGTDVPVWTIVLPAASSVNMDLGPFAMRFGTGLTIAATTNYADTDATAIATAGDVSYNIGYN